MFTPYMGFWEQKTCSLACLVNYNCNRERWPSRADYDVQRVIYELAEPTAAVSRMGIS